jgi:protein-tyrosine phosphatase
MSSIACKSAFSSMMLPPSPRPPAVGNDLNAKKSKKNPSVASAFASTSSIHRTLDTSTLDNGTTTNQATLPRKRALTDSAEEREIRSRTSPSFQLINNSDNSNNNHDCTSTNTNSNSNSLRPNKRNTVTGLPITVNTYPSSLNLGSSGAFHIPVSASTTTLEGHGIIKQKNNPRRHRAHSAMTADNLDNEQEQKLNKIMRAVMIMRITKADSVPIRIIDGLYIGSIGAAINKDNLIKNGITHILCAAGGIKLYHPNDFVYKQVLIADTPGSDMYSHLGSCCSFIGRAISNGGKVLVHCFAGKSRSATVLASYLMLTKRVDMVTAIDMMRKKRPIVQPNPGFCAQLLKWNRYIKTLSPKSGGSSSSSSSSKKKSVTENGKDHESNNNNGSTSNLLMGSASSSIHNISNATPSTNKKKSRAPSPLSHEMDLGSVDPDL